jgi:hypothetical protein
MSETETLLEWVRKNRRSDLKVWSEPRKIEKISKLRYKKITPTKTTS